MSSTRADVRRGHATGTHAGRRAGSRPATRSRRRRCADTARSQVDAVEPPNVTGRRASTPGRRRHGRTGVTTIPCFRKRSSPAFAVGGQCSTRSGSQTRPSTSGRTSWWLVDGPSSTVCAGRGATVAASGGAAPAATAATREQRAGRDQQRPLDDVDAEPEPRRLRPDARPAFSCAAHAFECRDLRLRQPSRRDVRLVREALPERRVVAAAVPDGEVAQLPLAATGRADERPDRERRTSGAGDAQHERARHAAERRRERQPGPRRRPGADAGRRGLRQRRGRCRERPAVADEGDTHGHEQGADHGADPTADLFANCLRQLTFSVFDVDDVARAGAGRADDRQLRAAVAQRHRRRLDRARVGRLRQVDAERVRPTVSSRWTNGCSLADVEREHLAAVGRRDARRRHAAHRLVRLALVDDDLRQQAPGLQVVGADAVAQDVGVREVLDQVERAAVRRDRVVGEVAVEVDRADDGELARVDRDEAALRRAAAGRSRSSRARAGARRG